MGSEAHDLLSCRSDVVLVLKTPRPMRMLGVRVPCCRCVCVQLYIKLVGESVCPVCVCVRVCIQAVYLCKESREV